jgi:hypothetical protein
VRFLVKKIIYPEGEDQEITHTLRINQLVDLNGYPVQLPLPTDKMIVYRVTKISTKSYRNEDVQEFYLELVCRNELTGLAR